MPDLEHRVQKLSPERRELLQLLARRDAAPRGGPTVRAPEPPSPADLIDEEQFSFAEGQLPDKSDLQRFYNAVNRQLNRSPFAAFSHFLNYGYVPNDHPQASRIRLPEGQLNRNPTRLVLEVVGDCELGPHDAVLDVGCGRGGTVSVLRRFFDVGRVAAIDLSPIAVDYCVRSHRHPATGFLVGDAEAIPFAGGAFDAVVNVDSSHGYGDVAVFYRQVHRVLRPGGHFLYADLVAAERVAETLEILDRQGFELERQQDVTSNVILSCDETAATHAKAFHRGNDPGIMDLFVGAPDSHIYNAMKDGWQRYLVFRFRKRG
jgi:SAM-dependent methyltransferase